VPFKRLALVGKAARENEQLNYRESVIRTGVFTAAILNASAS
jgi:hypothetical protein